MGVVDLMHHIHAQCRPRPAGPMRDEHAAIVVWDTNNRPNTLSYMPVFGA
jgi:hypothetical protein